MVAFLSSWDRRPGAVMLDLVILEAERRGTIIS